jgi:hypothetical protein
VEKSSQKFGLLLSFSDSRQVNYRPIGDNSPNLVTLISTYQLGQLKSFGWKTGWST